MTTDRVERHARLKRLFLEAVDADPGERRALVAGLSAEDPALGAELAAMLRQHCEVTTDLFEQLTPRMEAALDAPGDLLIGRRLGSWRLVARLGEGGMGQVYVAERADASYRERAAIKLSKGLLRSAESIERFRRERQVLADLQHPGIATLLDGGETPEGLPYLVLELVEGEILDRHCDLRGLDVASRIRLVLEICDGVSHAHRRLVVHRDIKPSNVIVDASGRIKLLDFGIAKLLRDEPGPGLTRTLDRPLTPEFAAPEQLRGEPITTATDVYGIGGLLYRLLAGAPPHRFPDTSPSTIEKVVCETPILPPSVAAERRGDVRRARELRGDLDNIVLNAMRREPERRYPSADALADDLRRFLDDRPVLARPDRIGYRARKFARRHRGAVAAGISAMLALLTGSTLALWQAREAAVERDRARREAERAERINAFLSSMLSSADPVEGRGRATTVAELLDRASETLGAALADQSSTEAEMRGVLAETYLHLGLAPEAEREARRMLALGGEARLVLATALREQGRLEEAEAELQRLLSADGAIRLTGLERGRALDGLLVILRQQGRHEEAIAAGEEAVRGLRREPHAGSALASALNDLALAYGEAGEVGRAEGLHREALARLRESRGDRHPETAEAMANLAGILDLQGRYREAEPHYRRALEIQSDLLGERHPDYVRTLTSYSNLLWLDGRPAEAEAPGRRALELASGAFEEGHPLVAYARNILGGVLLDLDRGAEAEGLIRAALESRERALPAGHWLVASARSNLGAALVAQGRLDEAERELEAALAALTADRGPDHEKTRLTASRLEDLRRLRARPSGTGPG